MMVGMIFGIVCWDDICNLADTTKPERNLKSCQNSCTFFIFDFIGWLLYTVVDPRLHNDIIIEHFCSRICSFHDTVLTWYHYDYQITWWTQWQNYHWGIDMLLDFTTQWGYWWILTSMIHHVGIECVKPKAKKSSGVVSETCRVSPSHPQLEVLYWVCHVTWIHIGYQVHLLTINFPPKFITQ